MELEFALVRVVQRLRDIARKMGVDGHLEVGASGKSAAEALAAVACRKGEIDVSDGLRLEYRQRPDNRQARVP